MTPPLKTQNSATLTIIIALFTLVPAVCYLLSAVIAKRYYTLKTPFLKKMMADSPRARVATNKNSRQPRSKKNGKN